MGNAVGQVRALEIKKENLSIPEDMEINFWRGGYVNTEHQNNNDGANRKTAFRSGCLTGITPRAARNGVLKTLVDILTETVDVALDCTVTLANGEKWSAPVFGTWDDGSFFNSGDGKTNFNVIAEDGYFNQV